MDSQLQSCERARTSLAAQIQSVLQAAQNGQAPVSASQADALISQVDALIGDATDLAGDSTPPPTNVCG